MVTTPPAQDDCKAHGPFFASRKIGISSFSCMRASLRASWHSRSAARDFPAPISARRMASRFDANTGTCNRSNRWIVGKALGDPV